MTTDTSVYVIPETIILKADLFDEAPAFNPEHTIVDLGSGKSPRYIYAYRYCYLDRQSFNKGVKSHLERKKVNINSLCEKRKIIVSQWITAMLEGRFNLGLSKTIPIVFDWIDTSGRSEHLNAEELTMSLYRDDTDDLRHRLNLSKVGQNKTGSLKNGAASRRQLAMAHVCSWATGVAISVVSTWAIRISTSAKQPPPLPKITEDEHAILHALHNRFFESFSHAVLNKTPPPVVVDLENLNLSNFIFYSPRVNSSNQLGLRKGERDDWKHYFYTQSGIFPGTQEELNKILIENGIKPLRSEYKHYSRNQIMNQTFTNASLRYMANAAVRHFGYLLLNEAGANASHLSTIDVSSSRLDKEMGVVRLLAVKGRSGYEDQILTVDSRFAKNQWKQYLKLREYMGAGIDAPSRGLFLIGKKSTQPSYTMLTASSMRQLSFWPEGAPSLASRTGKKQKTLNLLDASGNDVAFTSQLLSTTEKTVERHYAFKNAEEGAKELASFFNAMERSAHIRNSGIAVVPIVSDGAKTAVGVCTASVTKSQTKPRRIIGFGEDAPEPRCTAPATCLFCESFGIHADETDILRLLSIKEWLSYQTKLISRNIDEHTKKFMPIIFRIDEIIEAFKDMSKTYRLIVLAMTDKVRRGELDLYWQSKIDALVDAMEK